MQSSRKKQRQTETEAETEAEADRNKGRDEEIRRRNHLLPEIMITSWDWPGGTYGVLLKQLCTERGSALGSPNWISATLASALMGGASSAAAPATGAA